MCLHSSRSINFTTNYEVKIGQNATRLSPGSKNATYLQKKTKYIKYAFCKFTFSAGDAVIPEKVPSQDVMARRVLSELLLNNVQGVLSVIVVVGGGFNLQSQSANLPGFSLKT